MLEKSPPHLPSSSDVSLGAMDGYGDTWLSRAEPGGFHLQKLVASSFEGDLEGWEKIRT